MSKSRGGSGARGLRPGTTSGVGAAGPMGNTGVGRQAGSAEEDGLASGPVKTPKPPKVPKTPKPPKAPKTPKPPKPAKTPKAPKAPKE